MWVTCYADASFARKTGGGWAVWLRSSQGRAVRRGPCPPYVRDSVSAELAAIYAGVYLARRLWPTTTGVLVCSDCQSALAIADPRSKPAKHPALRRLQERLHQLDGLELRFRWVKGHQRNSASTAAWLNAQVDRLAGQARPQPAKPKHGSEQRRRKHGSSHEHGSSHKHGKSGQTRRHAPGR